MLSTKTYLNIDRTTRLAAISTTLRLASKYTSAASNRPLPDPVNENII